jgi:hypothetical protein
MSNTNDTYPTPDICSEIKNTQTDTTRPRVVALFQGEGVMGVARGLAPTPLRLTRKNIDQYGQITLACVTHV